MTDILIFGVDGMSRRVMERIPDNYVETIRNLEQQENTSFGEFHSFSHNYELPETGVCLTPDVRAYTKNGWKNWDELTVGEEVLSISEDEDVEWKHITQKHVMRHSGTVYNIESNKVDVTVTPDHKVAVRNDGRIKRVKASELPSRFYIPTNGKQKENGTLYDCVEVPTELQEADEKDVISLISWYLTEGWTNGSDVTIAKSVGVPERTEIENLLDRLGYDNIWTSENKVNFYSTDVGQWLKSTFGHKSVNKTIPSEILSNMSSDRLEHLLETMILGDGDRRRKHKFHTSSEKLRDAVAEICIRIGYSPSIVNRGGGKQEIDGKVYEVKDRYVVNIAKEMNKTRIRKGRHWSKREYDGIVWDLTVEDNHTFLVERNGKMHFTSNCWPTIYTGVEPEKHGHTHGGWTEGDSNFHGIYTVWDKLGDNDINQALWGMPMTYRAKNLSENSYMLSGFVSTTLKSLFDKHAYRPEEMKTELPSDMIERTSTYAAKRLVGGAEPGKETVPNEHELWNAEQARLDSFKETYRRRNTPDIVAYGTTYADKMGHINGITPGDAWTQTTYQKIDWMLNELIELTNPEDVVIISDHGFFNLQHDFHGYYLNTEGTDLGHRVENGTEDDTHDLDNFAPFILNYFDIEYNKEEYGEKGEKENGLTQKEKIETRKRLQDLGYDTTKTGTGGK